MLKNKVGLSTESLAFLAEDFAVLEKVNADLPGAVMHYLLDGDGEEILERLDGTPGVAQALFAYPQPVPGRPTPPRVRFFETVACRDIRFFIRLGKVLEAASRPQPAAQRIAVPGLPSLQQNSFGDPQLKWLEVLLIVGTRLTLNRWPRESHPSPAFSAELIAQLLVEEGHPPDILIRAAFQPALQRYGAPPLELVFAGLKGFSEFASRYKNLLVYVLQHPDFKQRAYALEMMRKCKVPPGPFSETLIGLAVESSKQVREQAELLLADIAPAVLPLLEKKIQAGENEERPLAARLLWKFEGEKARPFLVEQVKQEKNKKAAQALQELIDTPISHSGAGGADDLTLPPLAAIPKHLPLGRETETAWRECFDKINALIGRLLADPNPKPFRRNLALLSPDLVGHAFRGLQGPDAPEPLLWAR